MLRGVGRAGCLLANDTVEEQEERVLVFYVYGETSHDGAPTASVRDGLLEGKSLIAYSRVL